MKNEKIKFVSGISKEVISFSQLFEEILRQWRPETNFVFLQYLLRRAQIRQVAVSFDSLPIEPYSIGIRFSVFPSPESFPRLLTTCILFIIFHRHTIDRNHFDILRENEFFISIRHHSFSLLSPSFLLFSLALEFYVSKCHNTFVTYEPSEIKVFHLNF